MENKRKIQRVFNIMIKVVITTLLIWVIIRQLQAKADFSSLSIRMLSAMDDHSFLYLIIAFALLPLNILIASFKWDTLIIQFEAHGQKKAFMSVLAGVMAGLITPARLGEYVGRLVLISPENKWKGIWSNFVCSISQNLTNIVIGLFAMLWWLKKTEEIALEGFSYWIALVLILIVLLLSLYFNLPWLIRLINRIKLPSFLHNFKNSMKVVIDFNKKILIRVLLISFIRYSIYAFQFYLVLKFWGIDGPLLLIFSAIGFFFMVQSLVPMPPLMGFLARGEIALLIFGAFQDNYLAILMAAFTLWFINLVIPALAGLLISYRLNIMKSFGYGH